MVLTIATFIGGRSSLAWALRQDLTPTVRISVLVGLALFAAAIPFWIWAGSLNPIQVTLAAVTVTAVVLLEQAIAFRQAQSWIRARIYQLGCIPALMFANQADETLRQAGSHLLFFGLWLLGGAVVGLVNAIRRERTSAVMA